MRRRLHQIGADLLRNALQHPGQYIYTERELVDVR